MVPRVLVFQHATYCPLGTIGEHLATDGIAPKIIELNRGAEIPNLNDFDILIVLGGPMEAWEEKEHPWLVAEKAAIRRWVEKLDKPLLGICLGHQLLADALDGRVGRAKRGEAGLTVIDLAESGRSHPLYAGFGPRKHAINWHGSEVTDLPQEAVLLASSAECLIAAFAVGSSAIGVQYHVEATSTLVDEWSDLPAGAAHIERLHGAAATPSVRRAVAQAMPELWSNSRRLYDNFMDLAGAPRACAQKK